MIKKLLVSLMLLTLVGCGSMNSKLSDNPTLGHTVHAVEGIGGGLLGYYLIPKEWSEVSSSDSVNSLVRVVYSALPVAVLALGEECFNDNFDILDPLEITGYAIGTVTLLSIDF